MFPDYEEIDRTDALEQALEAAYELAVGRWGDQVVDLVLPTMAVGSDTLAPDPEMAVSNQAVELWEQQVATVIVPAVTLMWSYMYAKTVWKLNIPDGTEVVLAAGNPQDQEFEDWLMSKWGARMESANARTGARAQKTRGPRGLPYGPKRAPDMVAELVALAWDTDPSQIAMAAEVMWDKVSNRRKLEMFLGSYTPEIGRTIPSRVRDLLVGSTARASRLAIPIPELRAQMRDWMTSVVYQGDKPTGRWYVKGERHVSYGSEAIAKRRAKGRGVIAETEPAMTPVPEYWGKYREMARSGGMDTAGILNHAVLAAASGSDVQFDKVWNSHMDKRTRDSHFAADGQQVPVDGQFTVGGVKMDYPGDPSAPPKEFMGCRCRVGMNGVGDPLPREQKRNSAQRNEIIRRQRQGIVRARNDPQGLGIVPDSSISASAAPDYAQESSMSDETYLTFTDALFAVTGKPTDDRRMLIDGMELKMRDFPMPLMWQEQTGEGHKGSVGIGVIESMTYENGEVRGSGYLLNNENAEKALALIQHGVANPSIDMADATGVLAYADGTEVTEDNFDESQQMFEAYTRGTITAATIVSIPAFGQTRLSLNGDREIRMSAPEDAMVAAARYEQPVYDPALFGEADPNLLSTHRLRIDGDTGKVFGFIARWTDQHRSVGLGNIRPPRSETRYEHFHTSPGVHLTDGRTLPVGRLTVGIGHAPTRGVSASAAQAHYDNVDACWAIGRVSEHRLGLYFSGVVAPWASADKVQMGLASPVSGDWRPIGPRRHLELVAVLSVNTPGFLCKVETDEAGDPLAMVASMGTVFDSVSPLASQPGFTLSDIKQAIREVQTEMAANVERWTIGESEDCPADAEYAVLDNDTGKTVGCHATEEEALMQLDELVNGKTMEAGLEPQLSNRARAALDLPPVEVELTATERMAVLLAAKAGQ